jgi:hypothetical protein
MNVEKGLLKQMYIVHSQKNPRAEGEGKISEGDALSFTS